MPVRLDLYTLLLVLAVIVGLAEMIVGIVAIVGIANTSMRAVCLSGALTASQSVSNVNAGFAVACMGAIMVLLGILTIVAPFKPVVLISRFFLWSYLNFGVVMIICGILCLGLAGDLGIAVGAIAMFVGLLHIIIHFVASSSRSVTYTTQTSQTTTK